MLSTERSGRVLTVRVDNPPHNFMTREMVAELDALTRSLQGDREIGAVVITGKPDELFVTHYDVAEILAGVRDVGVAPSPALAEGLLRVAGVVKRVPGLREAAARTPARGLLELHLIHDVFLRMNRLDKVFIAAINGPAGGGGCELALACDLRYMADAPIAIGLPEMTLGFNPGAGGTQRLARLLGPGKALEMMLEGRALSPSEAEQAGVVHRVLPPERLLAEATETAERLARRPPEAVLGLKRSVYEGASAGFAQGLAVERKWFMSEAGREASLAAMERYVAETERAGGAPWSDPEALRRWQRGTAGEDQAD
ncbi:enoyl-CoA hydratase/isomerase family protein [soil metagenome]